MITRQIPFLANSAAKAAVLFCLPCPDQPARWPVGAEPAGGRGGQTVVTVNVPDDAGRFTPATVAAVEAVLKRNHAGIVASVLASPLYGVAAWQPQIYPPVSGAGPVTVRACQWEGHLLFPCGHQNQPRIRPARNTWHKNPAVKAIVRASGMPSA